MELCKEVGRDAGRKAGEDKQCGGKREKNSILLIVGGEGRPKVSQKKREGDRVKKEILKTEKSKALSPVDTSPPS